MVILANGVPFGGANSRLLVHALRFTSRVDSGSSRVMTMTGAHGILVHLVPEGETVSEIAAEVIRRGWRGVLVLRGVGSEGGFGSQRILIRNAILRSNMLKDLLVDLAELRRGVGKSMVIGIQGSVREARLVITSQALEVPIATVRGTVQALSIRSSAIVAFALPLVGSVAISGTERLVRHGRDLKTVTGSTVYDEDQRVLH